MSFPEAFKVKRFVILLQTGLRFLNYVFHNDLILRDNTGKGKGSFAVPFDRTRAVLNICIRHDRLSKRAI